MTREELLSLADNFDAEVIGYVKMYRTSGGGSEWRRMAADCTTIAQGLRARASTPDEKGEG